MFKALAKHPGTGKYRIIVGLADENCQRLLADEPIVFSFPDELPNLGVCIAYRNSDGMAGLPELRQDVVLVLCLEESDLTPQPGRVLRKLEFPQGQIDSVVIFRQPTIEAIQRLVANFVGPLTRLSSNEPRALFFANN